MSIVERVREVVEPLLVSQSLTLYDLEVSGSQVRITVDAPGGVDLEAIARATRAISAALDEHDPIPSKFTLEVSSPGLERPLRRPPHFVRAIGQRIKVKTKPHVEGERRLEGTLAAAGDDGIELVDDAGATRALAYDDIERANTIFVWGPAPKPGKKPGKASATKKAVHA